MRALLRARIDALAVLVKTLAVLFTVTLAVLFTVLFTVTLEAEAGLASRHGVVSRYVGSGDCAK